MSYRKKNKIDNVSSPWEHQLVTHGMGFRQAAANELNKQPSLPCIPNTHVLTASPGGPGGPDAPAAPSRPGKPIRPWHTHKKTLVNSDNGTHTCKGSIYL